MKRCWTSSTQPMASEVKKDIQKEKGRFFYPFARAILTVFSAIFYPCKIVNKELADIKGPLIIMCNHQSLMDPVLLAVKLNQHVIHFIGKRELTKNKALKWIVEHLHMIAVSRHQSDLSAMRAAGTVLKEGKVLGIFPEGGRRQGPSMEEIETGVSVLTLRHKAPLLPVYITGRPRPFRRTKMIVSSPLPYEDLAQRGIDKQTGEELNERIRQRYRELEFKYNIKTIK